MKASTEDPKRLEDYHVTISYVVLHVHDSKINSVIAYYLYYQWILLFLIIMANFGGVYTTTI